MTAERSKREQWFHSLGRWPFVAIFGVVLWGMPVMVLTHLFDLFPFRFNRVGSLDEFLGLFSAGSVIIWMIAGVIYGLYMWRKFEERRKMAEGSQHD